MYEAYMGKLVCVCMCVCVPEVLPSGLPFRGLACWALAFRVVLVLVARCSSMGSHPCCPYHWGPFPAVASPVKFVLFVRAVFLLYIVKYEE